MNIKNGIISVLVFCWAMFAMASIMQSMFDPNPPWFVHVGAGSAVVAMLIFVFKTGASIQDN